jgi:hypothetical protein
MSKTKKTATSDSARIAELEAQVAALMAKANPEKFEPIPRGRAYDPRAAMTAPALPDIYDASAIEADLRALGSKAFPSVYGKSSGMPGINLVEPQPQRHRANTFGEHIVDAICDKFLKD